MFLIVPKHWFSHYCFCDHCSVVHFFVCDNLNWYTHCYIFWVHFWAPFTVYVSMEQPAAEVQLRFAFNQCKQLVVTGHGCGCACLNLSRVRTSISVNKHVSFQLWKCVSLVGHIFIPNHWVLGVMWQTEIGCGLWRQSNAMLHFSQLLFVLPKWLILCWYMNTNANQGCV